MTTKTPSERCLALIAQWEYQCCGDPIDVGAIVELTLTQLPQGPHPGPNGYQVEWYVEHHVPSDPMKHVRAKVSGLWEWRIRRENRDGDGTWYPIAGTDEFVPINHMEVWDQDWQPTHSGAKPEGWTIELEVISILEPNSDGTLYGPFIT